MQVILAGHNLDQTLLSRLRESLRQGSLSEDLAGLDPNAVTPETLSAAYARISRDPRPIPELREEAIGDVTAARQSNQRIVFGFGHASVAEHAVFNLDVLGISRLAMEALEATRLGSYTEKSQRYILLDRDVVIPAEIAGSPHEKAFRRLIRVQQDGYQEAYAALCRHLEETHPEAWGSRKGRRGLEGIAKEDARYFLGMATTGQVGVTLNARSLESTIGRLAADPLTEVRALGEALHRAVVGIAPSLVRYTAASEHRRETPASLCRQLGEPDTPTADVDACVRLIDGSTAGDDLILTAIVHGHGHRSWKQASEHVRSLDEEGRLRLARESLRRMEAYEGPLRQYEVAHFTFELILSASAFAQLKRHRMATLLPQTYDPSLGITVPPSFAPVALGAKLDQIRAESEHIHAQLCEHCPPAATYALTNAHRRRVLFQANARELYHLSRLRMDEHAQWDIRQLATQMIHQAQERMPLAMMLAAGKSDFESVRVKT